MLEAGYYVPAPPVSALDAPGGLPNKNGAIKRRFCPTVENDLGVEDAQLERFADRLRAVHDVQLAQDFLHVVLHRERADLEDRADLEVRLAEVDPLQDVELAHGQHALVRSLVGGAR